MRRKEILAVLMTISLTTAYMMPAYTETASVGTWSTPGNPAEAMQVQQAQAGNIEGQSQGTGSAGSTGGQQEIDALYQQAQQAAMEQAAIEAQQAQQAAVEQAAMEAQQAQQAAMEQAAIEAQQAQKAAMEQAAIEAQQAQQAAMEQAAIQAQHAAEIGDFFKDSVLVGDSVALGFSNYAVKNAALPIFQNLKFLTRGSFSVHNAFMKISSESKHPIYLGEQRFIWDSIKLIGAKHAYTFFGLNDLYAGVDNTAEKYVELLQKIKEVNPDIEYTIISTTPMYKGSEKKNLNNENIRALNAKMAQLCEANGWGYIDIASMLTASDGTLAKQYCSDSYVHETNAAYVLWQKALEDYAEKHLDSEKEDTGDTNISQKYE